MKKEVRWKRKCPKCGEEIPYSRIYERDGAEKRNSKCGSCANKGQVPWNKGLTKETDERVKKYSKSKMGDKNPAKRPGVRKKISETLKGRVPWNEGKIDVYSEETLKEMRLSRLKYLKTLNGQCYPNHNPVACEIICWFNMYYGFNFCHAENGGEVCVGGYFPDGIDETRKTIIEIDEKHHFNSDGKLKLKDVQRQNYLESLGYKFIRVRIE